MKKFMKKYGFITLMLLGIVAGCGERGDGFHRTRSSPDGKPAILQSRAVDETGYVQPAYGQLRAVRGTKSIYHNNAIQSWKVVESGEVSNVQVL